MDERKAQAATDWYTKEFWHGTVEGGAGHRDALYKQRLQDAGVPEQDADRIVKEMRDRLDAAWKESLARELQGP